MISAILLAAGQSRRMGQLKPLLPFGSTTVIETCLDTLLAAHVDEVIVVLGHRAEEIRSRIERLPVKIAINQVYQQGMISSVKCGVRAVDPDARAVLVALVDQPLITPDIVNRLIDAHREEGKKIIIPEYGGRGGHPIIIDTTLREAMLNVDPQQGLRQMIYAHPDQTFRVPVATDAVIHNMNTWEEYQETLRRF